MIFTATARTRRMSLAAQRFLTLTTARRQLGLRLAIGRKIPLMPGIGDLSQVVSLAVALHNWLSSENETNPVVSRGGTFLYTSQEGGTEAEGSTARIHSPMYQNSRASCLLSFYYYVHGLSGNTFFKPGLHSLYPTEEIVLDYLGSTNVNKPAIELLSQEFCILG